MNWEKLRTRLGGGGSVAKKRKRASSPLMADQHPSSKEEAPNDAPGEPTRCLAIDCEFVGVGADGERNALARVSITNFHGDVVYDKFVKPIESVTDYRTWVSGVRPADLETAVDFKTAQKDVAEILKDRIIVGHSIKHDLHALMLTHASHLIRDTASKKSGFCPKGPRSLRALCKTHLDLDIQSNEHSSVEDARATMLLYKTRRKIWEKEASIISKRHRNRRKKKLKAKS
uniref:RNA exonuclease 4 n=2 Tax=Hirondellea gigas TaxID=1518452 RepID=A0A6A7G3D6_9CRUS